MRPSHRWGYLIETETGSYVRVSCPSYLLIILILKLYAKGILSVFDGARNVNFVIEYKMFLYGILVL